MIAPPAWIAAHTAATARSQPRRRRVTAHSAFPRSRITSLFKTSRGDDTSTANACHQPRTSPSQRRLTAYYVLSTHEESANEIGRACELGVGSCGCVGVRR